MRNMLMICLSLCFIMPARADNMAHHVPAVQAHHNGMHIANGMIIAKQGVMTGAFMDIINTTDTPDTVMGVRVPPHIAERAEIHVTRMYDNMAQMQKIACIDIMAQGTTSLKQGGYHIMLIGLKKPLVVGQNYTITLDFKRAGAISVALPAKKIQYTHHKH